VIRYLSLYCLFVCPSFSCIYYTFVANKCIFNINEEFVVLMFLIFLVVVVSIDTL